MLSSSLFKIVESLSHSRVINKIQFMNSTKNVLHVAANWNNQNHYIMRISSSIPKDQIVCFSHYSRGRFQFSVRTRVHDNNKEFRNVWHTSSWTANNSMSVVPSPPGCVARATVPLTDKPLLPVEAVPSLVLSPPLLASLVLDVVEMASISNSKVGGAKVAAALFSDSPPLLVLEAIELASLSLWAISHWEAFNLQEMVNKLYGWKTVLSFRWLRTVVFTVVFCEI